LRGVSKDGHDCGLPSPLPKGEVKGGGRGVCCHPSRLAEDGEHLRMTVVLNRAL
jgi:hypothetical protein